MYLKIVKSSNAFYNSAFFYDQLELIWLILICGDAVQASRKINAPGRNPVPFNYALGWLVLSDFPGFWACQVT